MHELTQWHANVTEHLISNVLNLTLGARKMSPQPSTCFNDNMTVNSDVSSPLPYAF
jgi:hypothetical protein